MADAPARLRSSNRHTPLLRQLSDDPRPKAGYKDEPWFSLWSALCHQGDVYSASYVAVPHVVQIALTAKGKIDAGFFLLPACIEVARATGRGPALAGADADAYVEASMNVLLPTLPMNGALEWRSQWQPPWRHPRGKPNSPKPSSTWTTTSSAGSTQATGNACNACARRRINSRRTA